MAAPLTTSSATEARRTAIDSEAVNAVATNPAFISSLNLPPIPASTPPLQRKEMEAHRRELINRLAWAAARGNESEFNSIYRELKPGVTDLTLGTVYGSARMQFLEKQTALLEAECIASLNGTDRAATTYWMRQLGRNLQERFNMDPQGMQTSTGMFESELRHLSGRLKSGTPGYERKMEQLLLSAIDAGYPAREVFATAIRTGIGNGTSSFETGSGVMQNLLHRAYSRASDLFRDCVTLYPQDSATSQVEFSRKYAEFRRLCAGLIPVDFDQTMLGRTAEHPAFRDDLLFHMKISADAVFVP